MTDLPKILEAVAALAWPAIVILILFLFKPAVSAIIESAKSRKFILKIGGQELTMEEANAQQNTLIADLQSQVIEIQKRIGLKTQAAEKLQEQPRREPLIQRTTVLWVDDQPKNNSYFVQQLSQVGITVDLALTTAEALKKFGQDPYALVISDMGRTEGITYNPTAGLDLLKQVRTQNKTIPFVIFCSARKNRMHGSQAQALGVTAITSSPTELMGVLDRELRPDKP
jgi:CheY-like chemotaxis protein